MTPEEFTERMLAISKTMGLDLEGTHIEMDDLMCEALNCLGYGDGVEIFKETEKWYA